MNPVSIITGTSSGVGLSLSVLLAERGHTVYATMRSLGKRGALEAAAAERGVEVRVLQLDVQDDASVQACVDQIMAETGRIDALVNNAGAGFIRSTEQASMDEIRWVMDVNFLGVVRCSKAVIPHMRAAGSGRIVNVSSVGGLVGQPFNEIYCAAKFAVEGYTEAMASYLEPAFGIRFTAVEPGGIRSEFANSALAQFQETGGVLDDPYKPILQTYLGNAQKRIGSGESVSQTPAEVAAVIADVLEDDDPPVRVRTSEWAEALCHLKTGLDPTGKALQAQVIEELLG